MKSIKKSVLIGYSCQEMYDLVIDAESYPQFIPWCSSAEILERYPDGLLARLGMSISGFQQKFTTRTHHEPGKLVTIDLVEGPFSTLHCKWEFMPLPATPPATEPPRACRINFSTNYDFASKPLEMIIGMVFNKMMDTFVDAFIKRAEVIYGKSSI